MVIFFSPELDDEESQATGDGQLTARMLCSVDNNFNLTRYNSIKIVGNNNRGPKISSRAGLFYQTFKINSINRKSGHYI